MDTTKVEAIATQAVREVGFSFTITSIVLSERIQDADLPQESLFAALLNQNCRSTMSRRQVTLLLPDECLRHIIGDLGRLFPLDTLQCCPKRLCFETDLKHLPAFVALLKMAMFRQVHV